MTDANIEMMRSIRQYQRVNEKITCVRNRMCDHAWRAISGDAETLDSLLDEKHELEAILRQASLDRLIRPDGE